MFLLFSLILFKDTSQNISKRITRGSEWFFISIRTIALTKSEILMGSYGTDLFGRILSKPTNVHGSLFIMPNQSALWCGIFGFCHLSFCQNKRSWQRRTIAFTLVVHRSACDQSFFDNQQTQGTNKNIRKRNSLIWLVNK